MKPGYLTPLFSLIVVLAMLLTAFIPAAAVSAASPSIELEEDSGEAGDTIEITGEDFTEDYNYYIFFDEKYLKKGVITDDGEFTKSITIPDTDEDDDDYDEDENYIITVFARDDSISDPEFDDFDYDDDEYAEADFYLEKSDDVDIYIELDPDNGIAGDEIEVYGEGFTEDYYYFIFFDEDYLSKKGIVDEDGEFSKTITIPDDVDPGKTYKIEVFASEDSNSSPSYNDDYDEDADADFDVKSEAKIEIDRTTGNVGDTFTLSGSGFTKNKTLTVSWDDNTKFQTTFTSDSSGTFSGKSYTVPETYYGPHTIKVTDGSGPEASISYSVTPKITISANTVASGKAISISGSGFKASSNITFYVDNTVINATAKTSASGTLSNTSLNIPDATTAGSHAIKAQDASNNLASVNVSVTAPSTTTSTPTSTTTKTITITTTVTASQPPPATGVPVWVVVVIVIAAILILIVIAAIVRRR